MGGEPDERVRNLIGCCFVGVVVGLLLTVAATLLTSAAVTGFHHRDGGGDPEPVSGAGR
ncbi:hypothetical protein [Streptomyces griseus]|uniref:hypothetical protein n=1 Tax=Streptomyces griseus TaxID=1911 RepID=UPI000A7950D5|nr:hypothetical protein [Streptomyces griseus]